MNKIEIKEFKKKNLKSATVIDGLPCIGLVNTIAANYLVSALDLDQTAALDSDDFPAISMVYASKPKFPARIYASEKFKIVVFLSEFRIQPSLYRELAKIMFDWSINQKCSLIISPVEYAYNHSTEKESPIVIGVGSTNAARKLLEDKKIKQMELGAIPGISGLLLNEGRWKNFDVISLIIPVFKDLSNVKSAIKAVESINTLVPQINIDTKVLYKEAEMIENKLKTIRQQAKSVETEPPIGVYK